MTVPPVQAIACSQPPATLEPVKVQLRGETPLQFLLRVMRHGKIPWRDRIRAAVAAAEYVHAKQPQAIHVTGTIAIEAVKVTVEPGPWNGGIVDVQATPQEAAP